MRDTHALLWVLLLLTIVMLFMTTAIQKAQIEKLNYDVGRLEGLCGERAK